MYSVLDKTKIKEDFKISIPDWKESLGNCINNLKDEKYIGNWRAVLLDHIWSDYWLINILITIL